MKSYLPRDDSEFWHIRFLPKISLHAYQNWVYIALYFVRSFFFNWNTVINNMVMVLHYVYIKMIQLHVFQIIFHYRLL